MQTPFLWAYAQLLVHTCHRRGAYAIGGMAAFVPTRKDPEGSERAIEKVRDDKTREAREGFDGTWVAHPALVPVAMDAFNARLRERTNQVHVHKSDLRLGASELLYHHLPSSSVTEAGLRANVRVTLAYLASWFSGAGAVAIDNLMEDTATAEISRTQVWQWVQQGVVLEDARTITADFVRAVAREELQRLRTDGTLQAAALARLDDARALFEEVALSPTFTEFLTWPAMDRLLEIESSDQASQASQAEPASQGNPANQANPANAGAAA
jgi:malate synthase